MRTIETGRAIGAALAALALCLAALAAACTSDDDPPDVTVEAPAAASPAGGSGADSGSSSADSSDSDDAGDSGADDSGGSSGDADDDASDTVSNVNQNPSGAGPDLDTSMNDALVGAAPLDLATWTVEPTLSPGELVAEGTLEAGAVLFFPAFGEGYAFAVHYIGQEEPLVVLLPDLGPAGAMAHRPHRRADGARDRGPVVPPARLLAALHGRRRPDGPGTAPLRLRRLRRARAPRRP